MAITTLRLNFKKFSHEFSSSTKNFMTIYKNSDFIEPSNIHCDKHQKKILAYDKENKDDNFKYIDYGFWNYKKGFYRIAPSNADLFDLKEFIKLTIKEIKLFLFLLKKDFMTSVILKLLKNLLIFIKKFCMKNIIFDRDGIINKVVIRNGSPSSPWKKNEFIFKTDIFNIIKKLHSYKYQTFYSFKST